MAFGGWREYGQHVLKMLERFDRKFGEVEERIDKKFDKVNERLRRIENAITALQVKAAILGAGAAIVVSAVVAWVTK